MSSTLDDRLGRLKGELDVHSRIARHLGMDFERPIKSLGDGYPENAVSLVGKIAEGLLKQLWRHHDIPGDPDSKALNELIKGCKPYLHSSQVLEALGDIRRFRNRSSHHGHEVADEDALSAVRRLIASMSSASATTMVWSIPETSAVTSAAACSQCAGATDAAGSTSLNKRVQPIGSVHGLPMDSSIRLMSRSNR